MSISTGIFDKLRSLGVLLGGIGALLIGIAAITVVFRGLPMSAQDQLVEKMAREVYLPELQERLREKGETGNGSSKK